MARLSAGAQVPNRGLVYRRDDDAPGGALGHGLGWIWRRRGPSVHRELRSAFAKSNKPRTEAGFDVFENIGDAHSTRPLRPEFLVGGVRQEITERIQERVPAGKAGINQLVKDRDEFGAFGIGYGDVVGRHSGHPILHLDLRLCLPLPIVGLAQG